MSTLTASLGLTRINGSRWLMILLTVAGLGVSAYLMWGYTIPGATLACGDSSGCETVKNSAYASLLGIPLPVMGLVTYATLLLLLLASNRFMTWTAYIALAIFGISLMGVLYSAYLTYLELFVIEAICRWCVASAIIMVVIFGLSTLNLYREG